MIAFDVTNLSNDTIDLVLAVTQASGDAFDTANVTIHVDDGNRVFDVGDVATTLIDEIVQDTTRRVFVVSDIPLDRDNGDVANLTLSARAHGGATPGAQGAVIVPTPGNNTAGIDTVLGDGAGPEDSARDGLYTARGSYTVAAAVLSVSKASRVLEDPVNGATGPKAIPGALIEYCIVVSNAAGSSTATNVVVTDVLPADLSFATGSIRVNGTLDASGNCTGGVSAGSISGRTITAPLNDIAASETRTASFRATIN